MFQIVEVSSKKDLKQFIDMAWDIYKDDSNWIPPIKSELLKTLMGKDNPLFMSGPHTFFLAYKEKEVVGRVLVGINESLNKAKNKKEGYFSLFECINDRGIAYALLDASKKWIKDRGMETMYGPVSPTAGDDSRGLLVYGFDGPPVLMNSYNPKYYKQIFEEYGLNKHMDMYAYHVNPKDAPEERFKRVIEYAMKKFDFTVEKFDAKQLEREIRDIKKILDLSMPDSWDYMTIPSYEEIKAEINNLITYMDDDLVYIARRGEEPIGFVVGLPDYNQVLKKLDGKLFPLGIFKYLWYKRKINGCRIFIQFVIPKYQKKAVISAIYYKLMLAGKRKGYAYCEGSTIDENNLDSRRSVEGVGAKHYRTYRLYSKVI